MSEENARKIATWLKGIGATLVITAGVFASTALDDGFGKSLELKRGIYALAGGIAGLGWIFLATGLSWHPESQILWRSVSVWLLVGLVAAAATTSFWYRMGDMDVPAVVSVIYAIAWIGLAGVVSVAQKGGSVEVDPRNLVLAMGAAVCITVGTLLISPWERSACLTEGPGQALGIAGWLMLVGTG
jgi:hypothetical protein